MKTILLPFMLIVCLLAGCSSNVETKKIVIGIDEAYAPFSFRNRDGEIIGFDMDLAKEVARRMGTEFEFKPIDWNKKREELESGNIDILWNGLSITPERQTYLIFTKPYMEDRQVILVRKGRTNGIISAADLAGKVVGTQLGAPSEFFINQDEQLKNSFAKFITYDNYKHAFEALADGAIDAVICDELVVHYEMNMHQDKFETIEAMVGTVTEIAVGFRKSDTKLRDEIQNVFDDMVKDGTAREISIKWFNGDLITMHK